MCFKISKKKCSCFYNIFCHFEYVFCFTRLLHKVKRNIILDLGSTVESVKLKRSSGDTPTRYAWLRMLRHGSVVRATSSYVLGSLPVYSYTYLYTLWPWINQITWPNSCKSSCKITFFFYKISSWKFGKYYKTG